MKDQQNVRTVAETKKDRIVRQPQEGQARRPSPITTIKSLAEIAALYTKIPSRHAEARRLRAIARHKKH